MADTEPKVDWKVLRGALLMLLVSLLISGALLYGGEYFKDQSERQYKKAQRQFLKMSRKYLAVDQEEQLIKTYLPKYRELESRGIIGEEHRLEWVESLRKVNAKVRLPTLRYQISSQDIYAPMLPLTEETGDDVYRVYASRMRLNLGLLHEQDLLRLFDELAEEALGHFSVKDCTMSRAAQELQMNPKRPNLAADCELRWFTIRKPDPDEELG